MPEQLWDETNPSFAKPVLAFRDNHPIRTPNEPLRDGQEVKFLLMLAGE